MSDQNENYQADLHQPVNSDNIVNQEGQNQSHSDTNAISINTSEQFQHIDHSISQQASSIFNNLEVSAESQQNQQNQQQHQQEERQQSYQKQQQRQQQEQQTQQVQPQKQQLQEKSQMKQQPQNQPQPQVDYQNIVSVKIFQKKINDALQLKSQGNQFFKAHQYKESIDKYSQGLRLLDPQLFYGASQAECQKMAEVSASLLFNIGSCFFNINSWKKAEIYFTQTITINPDHIKAIYKRALCRYELQNYDDAMTDIKLAFNKDKSNVEIHKSYEKILEKYNQKVKKDKENLKEMSSKIFRTDSQKSIPLSQKQQQKAELQQRDEQQSSIWGIAAPLLLLGGAALFLGYKKWFSK